MDLYFYWINLDKDVDRRKYMDSLFSEHNIKNIRIPAILGGPTKTEKEVACTQSHIKAIKTFLETPNDEFAIICEDDLSFDYKPYWKKSLQDIINDAPKDWEIIQLGLICNVLDGDFYNVKTDYISHKLRKYWSTICYVINRKSAEKIINVKVDPHNKIYVADELLYSSVKTYTYKYPMFTYRDNNDSNIHPDHLKIHIKSKEMIKNYLKKMNF